VTRWGTWGRASGARPHVPQRVGEQVPRAARIEATEGREARVHVGEQHAERARLRPARARQLLRRHSSSPREPQRPIHRGREARSLCGRSRRPELRRTSRVEPHARQPNAQLPRRRAQLRTHDREQLERKGAQRRGPQPHGPTPLPLGEGELEVSLAGYEQQRLDVRGASAPRLRPRIDSPREGLSRSLRRHRCAMLVPFSSEGEGSSAGAATGLALAGGTGVAEGAT
jgi:hypothetical protein